MDLPLWVLAIPTGLTAVAAGLAWLFWKQRGAERARADWQTRRADMAEDSYEKQVDQLKRAQSEVIRCHAELRRRDEKDAQRALDGGAAGASGFLRDSGGVPKN